MEVESLGSLPVGSLWWRFAGERWTLSILCKGTLELTPGELRLAARQDPVVTLERFADGDRNASLYAPSDLAPRRPMVDIVVVGRAYAPDEQEVESLTARIRVGRLDKSITIHAEDRAAADGPTPFSQAPLSYELAAGGPGTSNPVGIAPKSDAPPPRLVLGSSSGGEAGGDMPLAGLGPIAAHWPGRKRLLKGKTVPAQPSSGGELTLPKDFDLRYYNAAPSDQQLKTLEPGTDVVLENLHPTHAVLQTRLPRISPQVFVLRANGEQMEQVAAVDALWIDTERSVATINWRAQLELGERAALRKVWVVITEAGKRLTWDKLAKLVDTLGAPLDKQSRRKKGPPKPPKHRTARGERPPGPAPWAGPSPEESRTTPRSDRPQALMSGSGNQQEETMAEQGEGETDSLAETQNIVRVSKKKKGPFDEDTQTQVTASAIVAMPTDGAPPWLAPSALPAEPGPAAPTAPGSVAGATPPAPTSGAGAAAVPVAAAAPASASPVPDKEVSQTGPIPNASAANATAAAADGSLAAASSAAAAAQPSTPAATPSSAGGPPPVRPPIPTWMSAGGPSPRDATLEDTSSLPQVVSDIRDGMRAERRAQPRDVVELLWFDKEATPRVRQQWRQLTAELEFTPLDVRHDLPTTDPQEARDRHTNFGVLTEAAMTDPSLLGERLKDAISDQGRFTPPLIVIAGTLLFPFDKLEVLRATASSLTPLAGDDKKLTEALSNVKDLLDTPLLQHSNELIDNFTEHLRSVYGQSKRALSQDYLDATVERMLLEQRRYQKRTIFDGEWIRALLTPQSGGEPIPTYLPDSLEKTLPMMVTFDARMIVEAHVRQDQYEPHAHALRVIALGRVLKLLRV